MKVIFLWNTSVHGVVSTTLQPPSSVTQGPVTSTLVSVSWSQVSDATGYYVSYQRQDLGTPPVVTPQYERIVGGDNTNVTLSGLEPGRTYRIRVWPTDGMSVSSEAGENDVATMEGGELFVHTALLFQQGILKCLTNNIAQLILLTPKFILFIINFMINVLRVNPKLM